MILHINGPSGAGKTFLGNKLSKIHNIVDTDDIDDKNSIELSKKHKLTNKSEIRLYNKELRKANKDAINDILKKHKNIIFIGFLHIGMELLDKKIDYGFTIKVDPSILWRQSNLRTLDYLHNNYDEIKRLLESNNSDIKIHNLLQKQYKIRSGFDCIGPIGLANNNKYYKHKAKQDKYLYATSDVIYQGILELTSEWK